MTQGKSPPGEKGPPRPAAGQSSGQTGSPEAADEATRILPGRGFADSSGNFGSVIGKAPEQLGKGSTMSQDDAEDDRTVFVPVGKAVQVTPSFDPAVGWLTVLSGPGRGSFRPVFYGQNSIGRGETQRIRLNFGDARIARDAHAYLIYDDMARKFYIRDNGKANIVRLNNQPVMTPTEIKDRDRVSIGETVLLFIALCGADFDWMETEDDKSGTSRP